MITEEMKLAAAYAISGSVKDSHLGPDYIIPSVFDKTVAPKIAKAVQKVAVKSGVAAKIINNRSL